MSSPLRCPWAPSTASERRDEQVAGVERAPYMAQKLGGAAMKAALLVAVAALLAASPAMAQTGLQFGPLVSALSGREGARLGFYFGLHHSVSDRLGLGVVYARKGSGCCVTHTVEIPIVYRHKFSATSYLIAGLAPGYDGLERIFPADPDDYPIHYAEVSALLGLEIDVGASTRVEAVISQGLIGAGYEEDYAGKESYRAIRVGLHVH